MDEYTLVNNAPIMLFLKDKENRFIKVNKTLLEYFNITKEEINNKSCYDLFPYELAKHYHDDDLEVINTGMAKRNIVEQLQKGNERRWSRTDKVPWLNEKGEIIGVVGFALDITDQIILQDERDYLVEAGKNASCIIVITDRDKKVVFANPKFEEITGYSYKEILGKPPAILKSGKTSADVYIKLANALNNNTTWKGEFLNKKKDGTLYWEIASISPVKDSIGKLIGYVKIAEPLDELQSSIVNIWGILDSVDCYILVLDENLNIKLCNNKLTSLLGYTDKYQLYGTNWLKFIPENSRVLIQSIHKAVLDSQASVKEFINEILDINGAIHIIKWFNSAINSGKLWTFSIGLHIEESTESAEAIRSTFKAVINKDKEIISLIKAGLDKSQKNNGT